ncbi:MAG: septation regulator SpoVG [Chitinivibrionales bacterium]|nr:septation regulator SpoVG [Chitinivibrionales bacterium]
MNITEVRITLRNEEKLKAFASITFDDCFVVRGLKVINGSQGYFVSMPSRKRKDSTYQDIAHPINNEMRKEIEDKVLDAFEKELNSSNPRTSSSSEEDSFEPEFSEKE